MDKATLTSSYFLAEDFENLVRAYYLAEGYVFAKAPKRDQGYDFLLESKDGHKIAVEVKVYRTRVVQRADIIRAIYALEGARIQTNADRAFLFISSSIAIPVRDTGGTELVDVNALAQLLRPYPQLLDKLQLLARQIAPAPHTPEEKLSYAIFGDAYAPDPAKYEEEEPASKGKALCSALHAVIPGRKGARDFELRCDEALRYIFQRDFSNWQKQKITDGGISRFDSVARISSDHDLWRSIVVYFRSWYVVFEFKNYRSKISQGEIYTTEKYLFAGAMRTVAFIVSRKGADKNALSATRGAARESGKLIIHLSIDDVCKMLNLKDAGDDPNSVIFDIVDDMLMKLER